MAKTLLLMSVGDLEVRDIDPDQLAAMKTYFDQEHPDIDRVRLPMTKTAKQACDALGFEEHSWLDTGNFCIENSEKDPFSNVRWLLQEVIEAYHLDGVDKQLFIGHDPLMTQLAKLLTPIPSHEDILDNDQNDVTLLGVHCNINEWAFINPRTNELQDNTDGRILVSSNYHLTQEGNIIRPAAFGS